MVYFIQEYIIARNKYKFTFNTEFYRICVPQIILALNIRLLSGYIMYFIDVVLVLVSVYLSLNGINKRTDIIKFIKAKLKREK